MIEVISRMDPEIKDKKIGALVHFAALAQHNHPFIFLLGFLAGRIDWVHFVPETGDVDTWVFMSVRRRPHIHRATFQGRVGGVDLTDPLQVASSMAGRLEDIHVQLDFDGAEEADWYQEVLLDESDDSRPTAATLRENIDGLKARIDDTLDIYGECMKALEEGAGKREDLIRFFLERAENEMQGLSSEIARLQGMLAQTEHGN